MDGTLVEYNPKDYIVPKGKTYFDSPWFADGYFKNLKANENMLQAIAEERSLQDRMCIITKIFGMSNYFNKMLKDKQDWLTNHNLGHLPLIVTYPSITKYGMVTANGSQLLKPWHILIDDNNSELYPWQAGGGTAIKYLNGYNSPNKTTPCIEKEMPPESSFGGLHIHWDSQARDIQTFLRNVASYQQL
jgi:hypothetical protein